MPPIDTIIKRYELIREVIDRPPEDERSMAWQYQRKVLEIENIIRGLKD